MKKTQPSPQRESRSKQEELENLKATFIRNVEHELRTPLSIMQGYAELLRDKELGELAPEQEQALFVIVDRAYEMRTLVERIGALLSAEGKMGFSAPLALTEIITEVVKERQQAAAQAGLALEVHTEADLPPVSGDSVQLQQAFDCILDNAIKFTPRGGRIEVRAYKELDPQDAVRKVCFAVSDTGIGMAEDKQAHLFDGFYQADGSTTRQYGGIGLGLTVAKSVIEAHNGEIEVESQPGQGSVFTIKLPVLSVVPREEQPAELSLPLQRILVVDDEENVALTLQSGLGKLPDCEVVMTTSGEEALQLFERQSFDLLITDYKMPGTNGMTLAQRIRRLYPQTAIVMITAYSGDELREWAQKANIHRLLDKPVRLAVIREVAREALESSVSKKPSEK